MIVFFGLGVVVIDACKKKDVPLKEPFNPTYLNLTIPAGWP